MSVIGRSERCHLVPNQCGRYERSIRETWFLILKKLGYELYVYSTLHSPTPSIYTIYNHHNKTN